MVLAPAQSQSVAVPKPTAAPAVSLVPRFKAVSVEAPKEPCVEM